MCARNISIGRCVWVHLFHDCLRDRRTPWRDGAIPINSRGTSAPQPVRDYLYFIGDCILGPLFVSFCSWNFAIGRLIVHSFDTSNWNGGSAAGSIWGAGSSAAFRGIREVLFALRGFCTWI
jgi:hypothetical protein